MKKYIKRGIGLLRFHVSILFKKNIKSEGIKQYLAVHAKLTSEDKGQIKTGNAMYISSNSLIGAYGNGNLTIGNNNFFNSNVNIICLHQISIGDDNLFGQNVVVVDHNHNFDDSNCLICRQGYKFKEVKIGSDCWLGANVVVCAGAEIPDHTVIAANSVVIGKLEKAGLYVGAPARLARERATD
jgi:maltose O-acetyltransferase